MKRLVGILLAAWLLIGSINSAVFAAESPLDVTIESGMIGNIFFDAENAEFDVTLSNNGASELSVSAEYNVYKIGTDMQRIEPCIFTHARDYILSGISAVPESISAPLSGYGLYEFEVILKDAQDETINTYTVPFSNVVRNTEKSKTVGVGTHLGWYGDADSVLYLVKNAGIGNIRGSVPWSAYEKKPGKYIIPERYKKMHLAAKKYGLDVLQTLSIDHNIYDDGEVKSEFLREAEVEEYKNYLRAFLNEDLIKNNVTRIEIMNEPCSMFNIVDGVEVGTDVSGYTKKAEAYARMVKATGEVVDSIQDKEYKIGVLSVTGIYSNNSKRFADLIFSKLSPEDFDVVTCHPYTAISNLPENNRYGSIRAQADYFKNLANGSEEGVETGNTYNFNVTEPMWLTEFGYSSSTGEDSVNLSLGDEYEQAKMVIRALDELKQGNVSDIAYIYEMTSDGTDLTDREDNFEMVRSYNSEHPYSAKFNYVAVANYNSLTMNAATAERVVSSDDNYVTKYDMANRDTYLLRTTNESGSTLQYDFGTDSIYYYDLFGNKLSESDVMTNGAYNLTTTPFYAVVGTDIKRAKPVEDTRMQADVFVIKGRVPSGAENSRISLTVTDENVSFGGDNFENEIIFMDQSRTGAGGSFEFTVKVYETDNIKAHIVTEDAEHIVLNLGLTKSTIKVTSGGAETDNISLSRMDLSDLSVQVDLGEENAGVNYNMICAIYNEGLLIEAQTFKGSLTSENTDVSQDVSFKIASDKCDKMQILIINDDGSISPLCEAYVKK